MKTIRLKNGAEMSVVSSKGKLFDNPDLETLLFAPAFIVLLGYAGIGLIRAGVVWNALVVTLAASLLGLIAPLVLIRKRLPTTELPRGVPAYALRTSATVRIGKGETDSYGFFWVHDGVARFRGDRFGFDLTRVEWNPTFCNTRIEGHFVVPKAYRSDSLEILPLLSGDLDLPTDGPQWEASFLNGPANPVQPVYPPLMPRTPMQVLVEDAPPTFLLFGLVAIGICWLEFEVRRLTALPVPIPIWPSALCTAIGMTGGRMLRAASTIRRCRRHAKDIGAEP